MKKIGILLLCLSLSMASWAGLPITEIPGHYIFMEDGEDEQTLSVYACDEKLVVGVPARCEVVANVGAEELQLYTDDLNQKAEAEKDGRLLEGLAVTLGLWSGGVIGFFQKRLFSFPVRLAGFVVFLGAGIFSGYSYELSFLYGREFVGTDEGDSHEIHEQKLLALFTAFINEHGVSVESVPGQGPEIMFVDSEHFFLEWEAEEGLQIMLMDPEWISLSPVLVVPEL